VSPTAVYYRALLWSVVAVFAAEVVLFAVGFFGGWPIWVCFVFGMACGVLPHEVAKAFEGHAQHRQEERIE
jgi:hypothetical protein